MRKRERESEKKACRTQLCRTNRSSNKACKHVVYHTSEQIKREREKMSIGRSKSFQ